ncbi:MAG: ArnT family glycosyltransferase [Pseudobdellovibrionaceae bacterium]
MKNSSSELLKRATYLFVFIMLIRVFVALSLGLADDETYHWTWTRNLELSYFDHPGMIAWLVWISTKTFGDTAFAIRLPAFLLYLGSCIFTFKLGRDLFGEKSAIIAVFLVLFTPLWGFGGFVSAPELPFFFLWTFASWVFWQGVKPGPDRWSTKKTWLTLGVLMGLGLNSKFPMVFLAPGFGLYLLTSKERRKDLLTPWPWIGILITIAFCSPIFIWNYLNDWPGFKYQFHERHTGGGGPSLSRWLGWWGAQIVFLTPVVYFLAVGTFVRGVTRVKEDSWRFIFCLSVCCFLIFYPQPIFADYKPHWSGPAYWIVCLGIGAFWSEGVHWGNRVLMKPGSKLVMWIALFFIILMTIVSYVPFVGPIIPAIYQKLSPNIEWKPKYDFSNEFFGWKEFGEWTLQTQMEIQERSGEEILLGATRYEITSQVWYATKQKVWMFNKVRSHFTVSQKPDQLEALKGKRFLVAANDKYEIDPRQYAHFDSCEQKKMDYYRGEILARTFYLYDCKNFQGIR